MLRFFDLMKPVRAIRYGVFARFGRSDSNSDAPPPRSHAAALGRDITERVVSGMQGMRDTTEHAVLVIGEALSQIVSTATQDNDDVRETLRQVAGNHNEECAEQEESLSKVIDEQSGMISEFVGETKGFIQRQSEFAEMAVEATERIAACADDVAALMKKSHMLAWNMRIESSRMGEQGKAFAVISDEMKSFATDIREANLQIRQATGSLSDWMPKIKEETTAMEGRVGELAGQFDTQMTKVVSFTDALTQSLESTLDRAECRNNEIVEHSQATLSELQFQDPMAQELHRLGHDVNKLQQLIETGKCDDVSLAEICDDVGEDGRDLRDAGVVELF